MQGVKTGTEEMTHKWDGVRVGQLQRVHLMLHIVNISILILSYKVS